MIPGSSRCIHLLQSPPATEEKSPVTQCNYTKSIYNTSSEYHLDGTIL